MKSHRTDGLSLTFGILFLVVVAWWLVAKSVDLSLPNLGWFVAGALILLGVLGLVGALRTAQRPDEPASVPPAGRTGPPEPDDNPRPLGEDTADLRGDT